MSILGCSISAADGMLVGFWKFMESTANNRQLENTSAHYYNLHMENNSNLQSSCVIMSSADDAARCLSASKSRVCAAALASALWALRRACDRSFSSSSVSKQLM